MPVITISSTYGAGGSVVAPAVAQALGITLVDRAIPARVAETLSVPLEEAVSHDERIDDSIGRLFARNAVGLAALGMAAPVDAGSEVEYRDATERCIRELVATAPAVIVGRGGCFILEREPAALHVRLDGPAAARIAQGARIEDATGDDATRRQQHTDRARDAYLRHFYGRRAEDFPYHLRIDSTALPLDTVTDLIVRAARARLSL